MANRMRYLESVQEKKYKPLFGYGYEPRLVQKKERGKKQKEPKYDMFGNMIYELPVEAEADVENMQSANAHSGGKINGEQSAIQVTGGEKDEQESTETENGFEKPEGNPLMGVVIVFTVAIALFLIAVIMSLRNESETVRFHDNPNLIEYRVKNHSDTVSDVV